MKEKFTKLPLDSPERPIQVVKTIDAVPAEAEAARRFLDPKIDVVVFKNGQPGHHWRAKIPEGVMIAHVDEDETIALVDNYRHPIGRYSRELPGGAVDPEEAARFEQISPEERELIFKRAAIREFREEIGRLIDVEDVTRMYQGPLQGSLGFIDHAYHIFHGEGGVPAEQHLDEGEAGMLTHDRYSIDDAVEMIGHEIVDPATTTVVQGLALAYDIRVNSLLKNIRRSSGT
jgi:8-oxo-dGTP pyrophosphatase MutT (NUDIX family)